jgi:hypothetical protein
VIRLERSAHLLGRMHEELRALPASSRATRLIERNERERARIAEKLGALRDQAPLTRPARVK